MVQMPAVNTPQFSGVLSRLSHHAQPVPPIYQPEVIAREVLRVIRRPVRERWIGWSATKAIVGQRVAAPLLDRYLGRVGYRAQQTPAPRQDRPDNVDSPLPGDRGAHGRFDTRSRRWSSQAWLRDHLGLVAATVALATTSVVMARR
jgi:hypothetical protein